MENNIIRMDNPFLRTDKQVFSAELNTTVEEVLKIPGVIDSKFPSNTEKCVAINGCIIPSNEWHRRRIQDGEYLFVVPKVAGDDGKSILNIVMMIALVAVSGGMGAGMAGTTQAAIAAGTAGGAATMAAIYSSAIIVGGGMLISSLQPHPKPPTSGFLDSEQSQSFGWTPATIQRQGISITRIYGRNLVYGNVAGVYTKKEARTFSETTIADTYVYFRGHRYGEPARVEIDFDPRKVDLNTMINISIGPLFEPIVEGTVWLNDQPVENLKRVRLEKRYGNLSQKPLSIFKDNIFEAYVGRLVVNGTPIVYTTKNANFHNMEIEVSFPGLFDATSGEFANNTVNITIEIKKTTDEVWTLLADGVNITEAIGDKVIETYLTDGVFAIEFGHNYDVRVSKNTAERDDIKYGDDLFLDKVREITEIPFEYPRMSQVGINVQATDQISGTIRYSAEAKGLMVVDYPNIDTAGVAPIIYSPNNALVAADILTQPVYTGSHSPWKDLELMLNFEGADAATSTVDDSPRGHSITFGGGAELDTAVKKFGLSSVLLDGVDSYIQVTNDHKKFGMWNNLVEDWTLDIYLRMGDHTGTEIIAGQYVDVNNSWDLWHTDGGGLNFHVYINGGTICEIYNVGEIDDNDLHHLAICKVGNEIGLYKDGAQIGYDTMSAADEYVFEDTDLILGQINSGSYLYGWLDHYRIIKSNIFSAAPVVGLTDTITEPTEAWTDPGHSYEIVRYDGFHPSRLHQTDVEELYEWCAAAQVNEANFGIASISKAVKAVVKTTSPHPFTVGDMILFRGVEEKAEMEIADGTTANILSVTDDYTFTVDLDTLAMSVFTYAVKLYLKMEGSHEGTIFVDSSPYQKIITNNNVHTSTTEKMMGKTSGAFDGNNDYLTAPDSSDWDICANDTDSWTIHGYHWCATTNGKFMMVHGAADNYWMIWHDTIWAPLHFELVVGGITKFNMITVGLGLANQDWTHWALVKEGTDYGLYIDGVQLAYLSNSDNANFTSALQIGGVGGVNDVLGYMDEVMVVKSNYFNVTPDVGLTSSFTPPTTSADTFLPATVEEFEPRFSFNGIFDTDMTMWEAALQVCEQCRAVPFFSGTKIRFAIDRAKTPSYAFSQGNMEVDSFREIYIPNADKASEIEVHMRDRDKRYVRSPFTLMNADAGDSVHKVQMDLFGVTSNSMAERLARHRLLLNQYVNKKAIWSSDIEAIPCEIGDLVLAQNDVTNYGQIGSGDDKYTGGGRIIDATETSGGNTIITIDGEIAFADADWDGGSTQYKMLVKGKTDAIPETRVIEDMAVSVVSGGTYDITITGLFTVTPEADDVWAAGLATYEALPFILVDLNQSSDQYVDLVGIQYAEEIYTLD